MDRIVLLFKSSKTNFFKYLEYVQNVPHFSKLIEWGKLISITGATQVLVQGIGFISGILIIRLLPIEEYALYTLANTMLGTMYLLADGGISAGVLSQGGKNWQDREKLGLVVGTGLILSRKFALFSIIVSGAILIYLLNKHNASWLMTLLITASVIPAFYARLLDSIYGVVPRLHQDILRLQKNELVVGLGRLFLTASFIFIFPFTFLALLANGLPRIYGNMQLKKMASSFADVSTRSDNEIRINLLNTVKKMMPGLVYYCLSGQITIWLISILGSTTALAQLGALGRLAMVLSLVSSLTGTLLVPRFARLFESRRKLLKHYFNILLGVAIIMCAVIGVTYFFSNEILLIIGRNYQGLEWELILTILGACLSLIGSVAFLLNISRDWIINPLVSISISLVAVIIGVLIFDVTSLKGVLIYNIFLAAVQILLNVIYGWFRIIKIGKPLFLNP